MLIYTRHYSLHHAHLHTTLQPSPCSPTHDTTAITMLTYTRHYSLHHAHLHTTLQPSPCSPTHNTTAFTMLTYTRHYRHHHAHLHALTHSHAVHPIPHTPTQPLVLATSLNAATPSAIIPIATILNATIQKITQCYTQYVRSQKPNLNSFSQIVCNILQYTVLLLG